MHWQDIVLTVGQIIFIIALIPAIIHKHKPALLTSVINGAVLLVFSFVYSNLSLWFTAITSFSVAIMWFLLAFQAFTTKDSSGLTQEEKQKSK